MRMLLFIVIFALLFGCSANQFSVNSDKINVSFSDMDQAERFDDSTNDSITTLSFVMRNNEQFPADCSVIIGMDNNTNSSSNEKQVGIIKPGYQKNVSLHFVMFFGNTSLSIKPDCKRY